MELKYFFTILCATIVVQGKSITRVVGGSDAPEGKYPYQAFIKIGNSFQCGASILNTRYILTAAHCVSGQKSNQMKIVVGTNSRVASDGEIYDVIGYETHKDFAYPTIVAPINDIALVRLSKAIDFNDKIQPIKLPTENFDSYGKSAVLTGWGSLKYLGASPINLQKLKMAIFDNEKCKERWQNYKKVTIIDSQICTSSMSGEGACNGDSGGPLVIDGVQIGIVSFGGMPCGRGVPDVFTKVSSYIDWIKRNTY